ncbi:hypothetical protein B0H11DRAFT_2213740 [Mycena galericulata]|nr:hypothetical protein B0H11DRAFT_2213740 [Mycena galericulata]
MIRSRSRHANDPFIGRVDASWIPTPHTVNALAARIYKQENRPMGFDWDNNDAYGTMLLRTENSSTAYNPADTVDLLDAERPGSTLQEPVLLKVWCEVYYKVYDDDKKQMIRSAVGYAGDPFLGRVDTCQIPTPHTIGALAQHISKQENRPSGLDWDHDDAHGAMLLRTVDSPNVYKLGDAIDLLGADRPGSTPQEPVFLKV